MKKILVVAALAVPVVAFAKGNMKPGQWHIKVTHEMQGAPFTPPPSEFDKCVTPEQANDPKSMAKEQSKDCEPADVKVEGNKMTYKVTCHHNGGTQTGTGEMTWTNDSSYTGTMTIEMNNPRFGKMKMVNHMTGTRTGDCAK
jgi:Protein of unknown function (DUF3617)